MSFRALLIGFLLGVGISAFTMFNDTVISQSWIISHFLPIAVFGVVVALLLLANPLLRILGRRIPLTSGEIAIIAALGLTVCGWPSFGFYFGFIPNVTTPTHWLGSQSAWQEHNVMSYVPGASNELGRGHVTEWRPVAQRILAAGDDAAEATSFDASLETGQAGDAVARQVWERLLTGDRLRMRRFLETGGEAREQRRDLTAALNRVIREADLAAPPGLDTRGWPDHVRDLLDRETRTSYERTRLNRWILVTAFPEQVLPPPSGERVLVAGSERARAAAEMAIVGRGAGDEHILHDIDWEIWWPTLRIWVTLGLLMAVAALCLALIVHPQWSRRELLTYPLAQFVSELSKRDEGRALPAVAYTGMFWTGVLIAGGIHLLNGMSVWQPDWPIPNVPRTLDFTPMTTLFPNASRVHGAHMIFGPTLHLAVIAFAFFLNTRISFSVGIAYPVYMAFGAFLISQGIAVEQSYIEPTQTHLMRFGAYVAMGLMIMYIGRHYYTRLAGRMLGVGAPGADVPGYAVWAGRGMVLSCVLAVLVLTWIGLDWVASSLLVALMMLMFLILTRIVCETGMYFVQTAIAPVAMLVALFGVEAIGPTSFVLLALASIMILGDPRTTWMPYFATALQIFDRSGAARNGSLARVSGPMFAMVLVGCVVGGLAAFAVINQHGALNTLGIWGAEMLPSMPFDELANLLTEMDARHTLADATANDGLTRLWGFRLSPEYYMWMGVGMVLLLATAWGRLRFAWWPLHPVLFLIWGTMPSFRLAVSFLVGWAIKAAVIQIGGARGYHRVLPLMIGVIAGELLIALFWVSLGSGYYFFWNEGVRPPSIRLGP
ncbi:MAG: DUF6785 family protein [Phycisphaeraceae bacterium]